MNAPLCMTRPFFEQRPCLDRMGEVCTFTTGSNEQLK